MALSKEKKKQREEILSENVLKRMYLDQGWSAKQIAEHFRSLDTTLTATAVIDRLKKLNIVTRTLKESNNQVEARKRSEETCLEKYGAANPLSRGTVAFEKRNSTVLERYGVENVRQAPTVIERIREVKKENGTLGACNPAAISAAFQRRLSDPEWSAQFSQVLSKKAKERWKSRSDSFKEENLRRLCKGAETWWQNLSLEDRRAFTMKRSFSVSKLETDFFDLIEQQTGLTIERQWVIENHRYAFDGLVRGTKILIEVNGTFWHADPRIYTETDILRFPDKKVRTAKDIWKKDFQKQQKALQQGYNIIVSWEKDIVESPELELGRVWREYANYIDQEDRKPQ